MVKLKALVWAVLSGILLPLALPNELFAWGNPALGLIALAPLYLSVILAPSWSWAFLCAAVFGGLAHGISSYWLWFFKDFRFWTLGSTILAYMLVYGVLGLYLKGAVSKTGLSRPLAFAMVWTVFEWGKSNGFLGYPWGLLPYSWNTVLPAIQIAESTGLYGLSFCLAWINASLGELACRRIQAGAALDAASTRRLRESTTPAARPVFARRVFRSLTETAEALFRPLRASPGPLSAIGHLMVSAILLLGILGYGFVAQDRDRGTERQLSAIMVQQNLDSWESSGGELTALETSVRLAREAADATGVRPDVIMFSETTLRRDWDDNRAFYLRYPRSYPLAALLRSLDAPLLTGAPEILDYETWEATNSAILVDEGANKVASYAKMHPVPFAEAIPFWEYESFRTFIQNTVGLSSGWTMGSERVIFELDSEAAGRVSFAAPICFEDAFAYLCRLFVLDGAEVLLNLTNVGWSRTHSAEIQHFVAARFRAVELRRSLVQATNAGVSAVVHPDGRVHDMLPLFTEAWAVVDVPVYTGEITPYLVFGDWFPALLAFLLAIALALVILQERANGRLDAAGRNPVPKGYPDSGGWHESE